MHTQVLPACVVMQFVGVLLGAFLLGAVVLPLVWPVTAESASEGLRRYLLQSSSFARRRTALSQRQREDLFDAIASMSESAFAEQDLARAVKIAMSKSAVATAASADAPARAKRRHARASASPAADAR